MLSHALIVLLATVYVSAAFYEGETCVKDGLNGTCLKLERCQVAMNDLKKKKRPQICSFDKSQSIVCCLENAVATPAPPPVILTTAKPAPPTITENEPPTYVYVDVTGHEDACEPIPPSLTSAKTGRKAWDKCIEYQEELVYPCVKGVALTGELGRADRCGHNAQELVVGGLDAAANEFPHMALLGYGSNVKTLQWHCGGSLISDRFVLSAGHCTSHIADGPVTHAILGILSRSDIANEARRYKIKNIINHPAYQSPDKYNDIALLELHKTVNLDQFTVPACLHIGDPVDDSKVSATGWGLTQFQGTKTADVLQKVVLTKFSTPECSAKYKTNRLMKQGVVEATQICYGDKTMSKDTCQGDSGGPIQIKSKNISCMYVIVGVTSFGTACGSIGQPGIYTRVSEYVSWIESVVWP